MAVDPGFFGVDDFAYPYHVTPTAADVRQGVAYGPLGAATGTYTGGSAVDPAAVAAATLAAFQAWVVPGTGKTWEKLQKATIAALAGNASANGAVYSLPGASTPYLSVGFDSLGNRTVTWAE